MVLKHGYFGIFLGLRTRMMMYTESDEGEDGNDSDAGMIDGSNSNDAF